MNNSYDVEITYKQSETQFDTLYPQTTDDNVALSNETLGVFEGPTLADALIELKQSIPSVTVVEQATPVITVDENGLITATTNQAAGYVQGGTKTATYQIPKVNPAKPVISVDENGLVTSTVTQSNGYTTGGTASSTYQIPTVTQATPSISLNTTNGQVTSIVTQNSGWLAGGTKSATLPLTTQSTKTWTPTTSNQSIPAGTYLSGTQTIKGDSNLVASNIKSGVTIFGVTGNFVGSTEGSTIYTWQRAKRVTVYNQSGWPMILLVPPQNAVNSQGIAYFNSNTPIGLDYLTLAAPRGSSTSFYFYGGVDSTGLGRFFVIPQGNFSEKITVETSSSGCSGKDSAYQSHHAWGEISMSSTGNKEFTVNTNGIYWE